MFKIFILLFCICHFMYLIILENDKFEKVAIVIKLYLSLSKIFMCPYRAHVLYKIKYVNILLINDKICI